MDLAARYDYSWSGLRGYDGRGNRTSVTDANQKVTAFAYDKANRLLSETNPLGKVTSYEYDSAGNRRFKTDGNGRTEYQYDSNRRLRKVLFADGSSYDYDYDARGNRTLEKSPTHERGLSYDALGRLERIEDRTLGRTITYGYDVAGHRTRMELDSGEVVQYRWDALGRLDTLIDPEGESTRFQYDAAGRRQRADYGNRTSASYAYDAAGQVLSIVYANSAGEVLTAFGYEYDSAGNRKHKRFADGTDERYGYDPLDRLVAVDYPGGRRVEYAYDGVGNRKELVDSSTTVTRWPVSATASSENIFFAKAAYAVGPPDGGGWSPTRTGSAPEWLEVAYASAERATTVRVHELAGPAVARIDLIEGNGTSHTVYEGGDQTVTGGWLNVAFPLTAYAVKKVRVWTVKAGTLTEQIDTVGLLAAKVDAYQYNAFNQLLGVAGNNGTSMAFGYDDNGNQVSKTDASGLTQYVYNHDNRLVGIALPGGGANAFEYDANGLRTKKTDSAGTTRYLLDGMSVVAEYAPSGERQAWYTQSLARIDEVLNVVNGQGKYWYEADALGSTYALTNTAGAVTARGGYDVFGAPVAVSGSVGQPFGFTGREHELDSGLVYSRARYLNPGVGHFVGPDRLSVSSARNGGLAADPGVRQLLRAAGGFVTDVPEYLYAANLPTVLADPSGLTVVYVGIGGTAATFAGGTTAGFGMGIKGSPFQLGYLATFGLAQQLAGLVNISASVDIGIYPWLKHDDVCDLVGPFIEEGVDAGVGLTLAWDVNLRALKEALARGTLALPVLERPVGLVFSFPILPKGFMPPGGVTLYATWSWILKGWGCGC